MDMLNVIDMVRYYTKVKEIKNINNNYHQNIILYVYLQQIIHVYYINKKSKQRQVLYLKSKVYTYKYVI